LQLDVRFLVNFSHSSAALFSFLDALKAGLFLINLSFKEKRFVAVDFQY
jgi:hypothetical protein